MRLDTARCCEPLRPHHDLSRQPHRYPQPQVRYIPLRNTVAILDVSGPDRVVYLDSDSPPEDHIWALLEALHIVTHAEDSVGTPAQDRHLRVVPGPPTAR